MLDAQAALAAAARPVPRPVLSRQRVLLVGGGGALGAAVLERLLAEHRFERVGVIADAVLNPAMRRLHALALDSAALQKFGADTALVVFDRERHANGREAALHRPRPADLPSLATLLHAAGVRTLLVVVPHRAALLPVALRAGLASMDEGAVAALGFEQLLFMRTARPADRGTDGSAPQRLAAWLLSQLQWLVPPGGLPVSTRTVARVAVALAVALTLELALERRGDGSRVGGGSRTRVLAPEWLALAAQATDISPLLAAFLAGEPPPPPAARRRW